MDSPLQQVADQQALVNAWQYIRQDLVTKNQSTEDAREGAPLGVPFEREIASTLTALSASLLNGTWRPETVHRVNIPKSDGGTRPLAISAIRDKIVERSILTVVDPLVDPWLLPFSFAYRRGLGVTDAVRALTYFRSQGYAHVLRLDIKGCFENIPRRRVLELLAPLVRDDRLIEVVRLLIYRVAAGEALSSPTGLHQGSCLSPLLCNVFLNQFDEQMMSAGHPLIRYADDIVVPLGTTAAGPAALHDAEVILRGLGLEVAPNKLEVASFESGISFLGKAITTSTEIAEPSSHPLRSTVYVHEQGSVLRTKGERIRVEVDGQQRFSIGWKRTRQVVAMGRVSLTTPFIHRALENGVDVVLMAANGHATGRIYNPVRVSSLARHRQHLMIEDEQFRLETARSIVAGKIANQRTALLRLAHRQTFDPNSTLVEAIAQRLRQVPSAASIPALMGIEGAATHAYYSGLRTAIEPEWGFDSRRRRPPPDPVNSMLSFGYTLLAHDAQAAIDGAGLDADFGFLHGAQGNRPALALDLMEEFRPLIVDSIVLRCIRTAAIKPVDFEITTLANGKTKCMLTADSRRKFLAAYERRMLTLFSYPRAGRRVSYRQALFGQAEQLVDLVLEKVPRYLSVPWK